jgi:hypothetical protein
MKEFSIIFSVVYFLLTITYGIFVMQENKPVDIVSLTDKYDRIIAGKNAEIISLQTTIEEDQKNDSEEWESERQFVDNRCICKEYDRNKLDASGQFTESINPKQLSKQEICQ